MTKLYYFNIALLVSVLFLFVFTILSAFGLIQSSEAAYLI
jgi:hypothetical protein